MLSYKDLLNLIKEFDFTLVGYTFNSERIKDEFISNFSHIEIEEIDSSFSFKQFVRDFKIKNILNSTFVKNPEYVLIDLNNIVFQNTKDLGSRQKLIKSLVYKLRDDIYTDELSFPNKPNLKIIITSPLYKSATSSDNVNNFIGGSGPIYTSDLALTIIDNKIKIIKNRFGNSGDEILYNSQENLIYENNY